MAAGHDRASADPKGSTMSRSRILIVDDHQVVRQGLNLFLSGEADLEIVGEAANGAEALAVLADRPVDVVLMDLLMPVMDGITATREVRRLHPDVEVIALTSVLEDRLVHGAIEAGANGYMLKDTGARELADCIRAVVRVRSTSTPRPPSGSPRRSAPRRCARR